MSLLFTEAYSRFSLDRVQSVAVLCHRQITVLGENIVNILIQCYTFESAEKWSTELQFSRYSIPFSLKNFVMRAH